MAYKRKLTNTNFNRIIIQKRKLTNEVVLNVVHGQSATSTPASIVGRSAVAGTPSDLNGPVPVNDVSVNQDAPA